MYKCNLFFFFFVMCQKKGKMINFNSREVKIKQKLVEGPFDTGVIVEGQKYPLTLIQLIMKKKNLSDKES